MHKFAGEIYNFVLAGNITHLSHSLVDFCIILRHLLQKDSTSIALS